MKQWDIRDHTVVGKNCPWTCWFWCGWSCIFNSSIHFPFRFVYYMSSCVSKTIILALTWCLVVEVSNCSLKETWDQHCLYQLQLKATFMVSKCFYSQQSYMSLGCPCWDILNNIEWFPSDETPARSRVSGWIGLLRSVKEVGNTVITTGSILSA